jgi:hypothetical protein
MSYTVCHLALSFGASVRKEGTTFLIEVDAASVEKGEESFITPLCTADGKPLGHIQWEFVACVPAGGDTGMGQRALFRAIALYPPEGPCPPLPVFSLFHRLQRPEGGLLDFVSVQEVRHADRFLRPPCRP